MLPLPQAIGTEVKAWFGLLVIEAGAETPVEIRCNSTAAA
jgi:hypothetical protein